MNKVLFGLLALAMFALTHFGWASPAWADKGCSECASCAAECEKALNYLSKADNKIDAAKLQTIRDCVTLCKASAELNGTSDLSRKLAKVCAEACSRCADVCEGLKDDKLKDCVAKCKICHECCEKTADGKNIDCCAKTADAKLPECCEKGTNGKAPGCCEKASSQKSSDCCSDEKDCCSDSETK